MFDYIKGCCTYKTSTNKGSFITVEANGIGYFLEVMERDYNSINSLDEDIKIYTVLIHKEDKMSLCGFLHREDRDIFNTLTQVSGVGMKMAIALLNTFNVVDLVSFVLNEDYKALTCAKGVGTKLAQKIILELKDKLNSYQNSANITINKTTKINNSQDVQDAQMVLLSLGYTEQEITNAIKTVDTSKTAEEILRNCLQTLSV